MTQTNFVHLRLRSNFSIANSTIRFSEILQFARDDSQVALALTDLDNLFGAVKFCEIAKSFGIKPIVGCDVSLATEFDECCNICVLVRNATGYRTLCKLLTTAYATNKTSGHTLVQRNWLIDGKLEGLIILSGAFNGDIGKAIQKHDFSEAERLISDWTRSFPGDFFIELQRFGHPNTQQYTSSVLELASALSVPVVATHPTQFLRQSGFGLHEVRSCIFAGKSVTDLRRERKFTSEQYFKTQKEMNRLFCDVPTALSNTTEVAKRCNFTMKEGFAKLPTFTQTSANSLKHRFLSGVAWGMSNLLGRGLLKIDKLSYQVYHSRFSMEYKVIQNMGFLGYFLIVADFVSWAKARKIPVGPGRGSGAGSIVSFVLGVTEVEPLRFGLLFERFLNPERISLPDLDVDFCQDRRDQVIRYVRAKQGRSKVAQITTIGTFAARTAVKDVGRVLNVGYSLVCEVSRLIPIRSNVPATLVKALRLEPKLPSKCASDSTVRMLVDRAVKLEGLVRNVAVHAGGLLIASAPLTGWCPVYSQYDTPYSTVSQFDKDDVETVGLTKFDLLGLTTLTVVDSTAHHIRNKAKLPTWQHQDISGKDQLAFQLLQTADTAAIFQFESQGMRSLLKLAKPQRLEDIVALVALYRPGPISLTYRFVSGRVGHKQEPPIEPALDPILSETYGALLYQEQVMRIAQGLGDYSLSEADLFRRAISKKQANVMPKHRKRFVSVATAKGLSLGCATSVFQSMERFAGYGFNKSHAAAYATLSYRTAWLKAHHPTEFLASSLSYSFGDLGKLQRLRNDCMRRGIRLLSPNINRSFYRFGPVCQPGSKTSGSISFGLGSVKGCSRLSVGAILRERENRTFGGILDFCRRIDRNAVSQRVIAALVRVGAFDHLHGTSSRASLLQLLPQTLKYSENILRSVGDDIAPFATVSGAKFASLISGAAVPFTERRLTSEEHKTLGFYYNRHPFRHYSNELRQVFRTDLFGVREVTFPKARADVCGIITALTPHKYKRKPAVIVTIEDDTGQCLVVVPSGCPQCSLSEGKPIAVTGSARITWRRMKLTLVASLVQNLNQVRFTSSTTLSVKCPANVQALAVRKVLKQYSCPDGDQFAVWVRIGTAYAIGYRCRFSCSLHHIAVRIRRKAFPSFVSYYYCEC